MSGEMMTFPSKWEQFLHDYEFEDARRIYTNGSRLIPSFRVKQMMSTTRPASSRPDGMVLFAGAPRT